MPKKEATPKKKIEDLKSSLAEGGSPQSTLSQDIIEVFEDGKATIGELIETTKKKGFGFLFVVFGLPMALPLPPGVATPFGAVLVCLWVQVILGREYPWFPQWVLKRSFGKASGKFMVKLSKLLARLERYLKPRMRWYFHRRIFRPFVAPLLMISAMFIMLPLPGTNSTPSLGIGLIGLGMLEEDGVFGIVGTIIALIGCCIAGAALAAMIWGANAGFNLLGGS